jgi:hypothetical protein
MSPPIDPSGILVPFSLSLFSLFSQDLSLERLAFSIALGRRLFEVLPPLELTQDSFLFNHALKTLQSFLQRLVVMHYDYSDTNPSY